MRLKILTAIACVVALSACGQTGQTYSMVTDFPNARLNNDVAVDTPSGHGGFYTDAWETTSGPQKAVIIVSGFNLTYPVMHITAGQTLKLDVGMAYPSPYPEEVWLAAKKADGTSQKLWSKEITLPTDKTVLEAVTVDLSPVKDSDVQLVLGVDTNDPDPSHSAGHWGVFVDPTVK